MSISKTVELEVVSLEYYSQKDEDAFFEWLQKIKSVAKLGGHGKILVVTVDLDLVDQDDVREFLALFHRYGIDKKQLKTLVKPEYQDWFIGSDAYWYEDIFGNGEN